MSKLAMLLISLDIDGAEWTCGAEVFARSAADASLGIDSGYLWRSRVTRHRWYHLYSSCRAMSCAVATFHAVSQWDAVGLYPHGVSYLGCRLVRHCDWLDCPGGADVGATCTFGTAVAPLVGHLGLHEAVEPCRRAQHFVWADRHAQLTPRAVLVEVAAALCPGRHYGHIPVWSHLVFDDSQSSVYFLFLRLERSSGGEQGSGGQEVSPRHVGLVTLLPTVITCAGSGGRVAVCEADGRLVALVDAVHARHTPAVVYAVCLDVDTCRLAVAFTEMAVHTLAGVDDRF